MVGVVALAPAPTVQLDIDARRLAVAGGAEEAALAHDSDPFTPALLE